MRRWPQRGQISIESPATRSSIVAPFILDSEQPSIINSGTELSRWPLRDPCQHLPDIMAEPFRCPQVERERGAFDQLIHRCHSFRAWRGGIGAVE
jgi:hypothetical protein